MTLYRQSFLNTLLGALITIWNPHPLSVPRPQRVVCSAAIAVLDEVP